MKNFKILAVFALLFCQLSFTNAQSNLLLTNPAAEKILLGNYDPLDFSAANPITDPAQIVAEVSARISPDSLKAYILQLAAFETRNTGSDTVSATSGIGAARRWVHSKFQDFSATNENRLVPAYLQFDLAVCGMGQHRNILAVLPGSEPTRNGVILVEGHMDSRCAVLCDVTCLAQGVEDNASGTALVLELARVMARYTFKNTIVFLVTIGEEQGLVGAEAFADYVQTKNIPLRAVLNNDVIGGVACGETSSPPSCPGLGNIDSTSVRLFSSGSFNSKHKQLARFIKLEYQENLLPSATIPMNVRIMSPEDRTGRGGDHIPFREHNYAAMRFTAANEHGDASNSANYHDRQHTSDDILGKDTDGDGAVDSFFVQFNYLARNAVLNANALAMAAIAVPTPNLFTATRLPGGILNLDVTDSVYTGEYRIALRSTLNDWDAVHTLTGSKSGTFDCNPTGPVYVSIAAVNADGVESLFSGEKLVVTSTGTDELGALGEETRNIRLFQNRPNPFDEATWISFWVNEVPAYRSAFLQITDLQGKAVQQIPVSLKTGMNEVLYTHGYGGQGTFTYALVVDGKTVDARTMVFAN